MPDLTVKQKGFIDDYLGGTKDLIGNATRCYMKWYKTNDPKIASANSSKLLRKDYVKDYMSSKSKSIVEILEENSNELLKIAIKQAKTGNSVILNKLLDKIIPSLALNENVVQNLTADQLLDSVFHNAVKSNGNQVNMADNESNDIPSSDTKPVSIDNTTS